MTANSVQTPGATPSSLRKPAVLLATVFLMLLVAVLLPASSTAHGTAPHDAEPRDAEPHDAEELLSNSEAHQELDTPPLTPADRKKMDQMRKQAAEGTPPPVGQPKDDSEQARSLAFLSSLGFTALEFTEPCVATGLATDESQVGCWESELRSPATYNAVVDPDLPTDPAAPENDETWAPDIVPVFSALLPSGKILYWDWKIAARPGDDHSDPESTRAFLWDPVAEVGERKDVDELFPGGGVNLFCAGYVHLPNGDLLLAGGNRDTAGALPNGDTSYNDGTKTTFIFRWQTETWERGPDMDRLRWYPSLAALATGELLILGGDPIQNNEAWANYQPGPARPEVAKPTFYDGPDSDAEPDDVLVNSDSEPQIRPLTNLQHTTAFDNTPPSWRLYPFLFPSQDGRVVYLGPDTKVFSIDTDGAGASQYEMERDTTNRAYGTWAQTGKGSVIVNGGDDTASEDEPGKVGASWTGTSLSATPSGIAKATIGEMAFKRRFHYLTTLPDGKVLATGGMESTVDDSDECDTGVDPDPQPGTYPAQNPGCTYSLVNSAHATKKAEIYAPSANAWTTLPAAQRGRMYHSMAALLPDGRVITGGGGICGTCNWFHHDYYEPNFEYYEPAYLWESDGNRADRPQITGGATVTGPSGPFAMKYLPPAAYGSQITVGYDLNGGPGIARATLVKLGAPTHGVDQGQRYVPVTITGNSGTQLTLAAPRNGYEATPGYYMLFLINSAGVPSEAQMIRVGADLAFKNLQSVVTATNTVNFNGVTQKFGLGTFTADDSNLTHVGDNDISSLKVAAGYQVTVCANSDGTDCVVAAPGEYPALGQAFDERVSYLKVAPHTGIATDPRLTDWPQPVEPPTPVVPDFELRLRKKMKFGKSFRFKAICEVACTPTITLINGKKKTKLKTSKLKASPNSRTITVKFSSKLYKSLKSAMRSAAKKKKVTLRITLVDAAGQKATAKARFM
ncbi:MAG: galactose oxidase-like domain-containing protein [Solirubrobacterales bacterium]